MTASTSRAVQPVSFAQRRLWLLDQLTDGNSAYNLFAALRLRGALDATALRDAVRDVVRRHDILRTTFTAVDGQPRQVVAEDADAPLSVVDVSELPAVDREPRVRELVEASVDRAFDLAEGPLSRFTLFRIDDTDHVFAVVCHHMLWDGWSMGQFLRELSTGYAAHRAGLAAAPDPLPLQYGDYAVRQHRDMAAGRVAEGVDWWRSRLAGAPTLLNLPTTHPRPAVQGFAGATVDHELGPDLWRDVALLARRYRVTPFMVLLAGFAVLLSRLSGGDDLVVGTPSAGRTSTDLQALIGMFVNTLPLRVDLTENPTFEDVLRRVRRTTLDAFGRQDVPLELIVSELRPDRALSHDPLFQVMFALQQPLAMPSIADVAAEIFPIHSSTTFTDLWLDIRPAGEGAVATFRYRTELFDAATVTRIAHRYGTVLRAAVDTPDTRVSALPLLDAEEHDTVLRHWSRTADEHPWAGPVHELVAEQAERTPDATAVVFEDTRLAYAELTGRVRRLGGRLTDHADTGADTVIGICLPRSASLVVSILAVMGTGSAYLPLSPDDPPARLRELLRASGATQLVTTPELLPTFADSGIPVLAVADNDPAPTGRGPDTPSPAVDPDDLAYVIYTSGSTGTPKAVGVPHAGLANRIRCMQDSQMLTTADRVLHKTPYTFDVSVWELLWPLTVGATLVVAAPGGHRDPAYLVDLIERESVTTVHFVTPMLEVFLDQPDLHRCRSLTRIVCSGQAMSSALRDRCLTALPARLFNLYGPTEASIEVTEWECGVDPAPAGEAGVPIGRPIAGVETYVLDRELNPSPVGVAGELYLGGVALARGYLGRPGLTADRFVPHPYARGAGARLYRTGDLVRWRADGVLEFLGCNDHQVKIRGFRIEPGEIENAARTHPGVRDVVVTAVPAGGEPRLVAYLVPHRDAVVPVDELRGWLRDRLPEYMLPSHVDVLTALPLTSSGKVDRAALPAPTPTGTADRRAPEDETERRLVGIWADVLGVAGIGTGDDFFQLGGDSLKCVQVSHRARAAGLPVAVSDMFHHPTVRELAEHLRSTTSADPDAAGLTLVPRAERSGQEANGR